MLRENPWKGVKAPGYQARTRVLTYEEEAKLRATLRPDYQRLLTVTLGTGARETELLGMTPTSITGKTSGSMASGGKRRQILPHCP